MAGKRSDFQGLWRRVMAGLGFGAEPMRARALGPAYSAAGYGPRATTWRASNAGPNAALNFSLPTLRTRARDAVRQNAYAASALDSIVTNIVGTGIKPQFRTRDAEFNRELAGLWLAWAAEADADGRGDFYQLQSLAVRAMVEGGEAFVRFRDRRLGDVETVPLQLQLLESEYCPVDWVQAPAGRDVRNGVEFDRLGRRVAYWLYRNHPEDLSLRGFSAALTPAPVPASEIAHLYNQRRPGQVRGEPWLARALIKLRELDDYDDAELVRKKTAAMLAGFITNNPEDGGFAGESAPDAHGVSELVWEPGTLARLAQGEDIRFSEPGDVGANYDAFMRQQLRAVAAAAGVLYEQLTGDYSTVNDRTFRASVNEFRRRAEAWQHNLVVFQLCLPTLRRWLDLALMAGALALPRGVSERDVIAAKWVPQGWSYIHPVQEVQAAREAVRAGFKSRAEVVSELGYDVEEIDAEIAADKERADALGLVLDSDGRQPSRAVPAPPDEREPGAAA
jgi:lambda family phage portal protein